MPSPTKSTSPTSSSANRAGWDMRSGPPGASSATSLAPPCCRTTSFSAPNRASNSSSPDRKKHTSELQSHVNLVCRLLLEKKKQLELKKHFINKQPKTHNNHHH